MSTTARELSVMKAVAGVVREHVGKAFDSLAARLKGVEDELSELRLEAHKVPEKGDPGKDGTSVTAEDVLPELKSEVARLVADFPAPKDGKDGIDGKDGKSITAEDVRPIIEQEQARLALDFERRAQDILHRAIERIPPGRDGIDGRDGKDGQDADPEAVAAKVIERLDLKGTRTDLKKLCKELVDKEVSRFEPPKDGADGKDGRDATDAQVADAVAAYIKAHPVRDGKDGQSITPEQIKALLDERAASWELDFEKRAQAALEKAIDRMPKPRDGKDGIGFDDFSWEFDGERTLRALSRVNGEEREHKFILPIVIDQGVYKDGQDYARGDGVTWGGSFWISQVEKPKGKPGQFNKDWRLAVKRGRDGK
jgi:hypothetical protein